MTQFPPCFPSHKAFHPSAPDPETPLGNFRTFCDPPQRKSLFFFVFHKTAVTMLQRLSFPQWHSENYMSENVSMCRRPSWSKWKKSTGQRRNQTPLNKKTWSGDIRCTAVSSSAFAKPLWRWCCGRDTSCFRIHKLRLHHDIESLTWDENWGRPQTALLLWRNTLGVLLKICFLILTMSHTCTDVSLCLEWLNTELDEACI